MSKAEFLYKNILNMKSIQREHYSNKNGIEIYEDILFQVLEAKKANMEESKIYQWFKERLNLDNRKILLRMPSVMQMERNKDKGVSLSFAYRLKFYEDKTHSNPEQKVLIEWKDVYKKRGQ